MSSATQLIIQHAADAFDPPPREAFIAHADWCRRELPHIFTLPYGPHHIHLFDGIGATPRGTRQFDGAPRGSGKTSAVALGAPLSAAAQGTHNFIAIIRGDQIAANTAIEILRAELERNEDLVARWPRLKLRRRIRVKRDEKETTKELRLAGATIVGLGAGGKVRGLLRRGNDGEIVRPDLVIIDIEESAEQARSKLRTDRLEEWLIADVGQLGGNRASNPMDLIAIGTTIDTDALVTRAINGKGRFKSWRVAKFPAEYVDAHGIRKAMWPEGQPLDHLDQLLDADDPLFIGTFTYAKEYLLNPRKRTNASIDAAWLRWGKPPGELERQALGIDPATDEASSEREDYSALVDVAMGPDGMLYVRRKWRGHVSSKRLFDVAESMARDDEGTQAIPISYEAIAGFAWGVQELRRRGLAHRAVKHLADKVSRFQVVALFYEAGMVWHDPSMKDSDFEDELLDFPGGEHDDYVDALYHAIMLATNGGPMAWAARRRAEASK